MTPLYFIEMLKCGFLTLLPGTHPQNGLNRLEFKFANRKKNNTHTHTGRTSLKSISFRISLLNEANNFLFRYFVYFLFLFVCSLQSCFVLFFFFWKKGRRTKRKRVSGSFVVVDVVLKKKCWRNCIFLTREANTQILKYSNKRKI